MYEQTYEDKQLACVECNCEFEFSGEDQEFYAKKGYSEPKRCPACRDARKARSNNSRGGGYRERQSFSVTCAACGCETTVPFRPSEDRPVFCSDCYRNNK